MCVRAADQSAALPHLLPHVTRTLVRHPEIERETVMHLSPGDHFYEDVDPGDYFETDGMTITEAHLVFFAGLSGDLFSVHMDDAFAREQGFDGRIAHGLLGLVLLDGLKTRSPIRLKAIASLGWNWSFAAPIYPGERISGRFELAAKRQTRNRTRGIFTLAASLCVQDGRVVQKGDHLLMVHCRNAGPA